ncbi:MAG: HNH endonuclease [Saprospiraceae bacterium]
MPDAKITPELRNLVRARAQEVCEYCLALSLYSSHPFAIDHILPTSKGGENELANLAFTCQHCNNTKYNKTEALDPMTGNMFRLFNPRLDIWAEHFMWNEGFTLILGVTTIGRATVFCLKMNRESARNLRAALYQFGVHPPY